MRLLPPVALDGARNWVEQARPGSSGSGGLLLGCFASIRLSHAFCPPDQHNRKSVVTAATCAWVLAAAGAAASSSSAAGAAACSHFCGSRAFPLSP
jgi:hypothetical protein